jgi:hypothetical protein
MFRNNEGMTFTYRSDVHERQNHVVLVDYAGRCLLLHDFTENTVFTQRVFPAKARFSSGIGVPNSFISIAPPIFSRTNIKGEGIDGA